MIRAAVYGGSGYTGAELIRLLSLHPQVQLEIVSSRREAGKKLSEHFATLRNVSDLKFINASTKELANCDVVFFATPHGVCMQKARELLDAGVRIVDLSADFRLQDVAVFEKWYKIKHLAPDLLRDAAYGLPELHREKIKSARLVAAAGCYPTAVQLGFAPLLKSEIIAANNLIADVKSGVSGAGREAKTDNLFAEIDGNFKVYAGAGHRHQPEIEQGLRALTTQKLNCAFVPHLIPMVRGIEATLYAPLTTQNNDINAIFAAAYRDEFFVDVLPTENYPQTRSVTGSNFARIGTFKSLDGNLAIVSVTIDNLLKGASGQAVQCMNIMFDFPENSALTASAIFP